MEEKFYTTWKEFNQDQLRKAGTVQLCVDELARDLYYDDSYESSSEEVSELNFD